MPNPTMKAVGFYKALPLHDPQALLDLEIPTPAPGPMDLLVQIEAIAVNPADLRVRERERKADDGELAILGWDAAGTVLAAGEQAARQFSVGDAVYYAGDLTRPGANSQFHVIDSRLVGQRPRSLSATQAAAVPLCALTAWEALFERMGFSRSAGSRFKTLLIVGGAGGVGSMAIQLARLIPGLRVIATASRPESRAWCQRLGVHDVIDHFGDMRAQLAGLGLAQADAILLLNDPDRHFPALADLLAAQGTLCCVVPFKSAPDINALMRKSATLAWEFMFTRPLFATADIAAQRDILDTVAGLLDDGLLTSPATQDLGAINAENLRAAHRQLASGRTIGKLTLSGF